MKKPKKEVIMKTIQKKLMCMAVAAMACMSVNAQATSGSCGDNATWEYDNGTLTIAGTGAMADYTDDPSSTPWAAYRTSVTKVVVGDNITTIGNCAFNMFTALTDVTIGESVETIGIFAFDNCTAEGFTTLNIPNSVTTIKSCAFSNNHLETVRMGSGITEIWQQAFMQCTYLRNIVCAAATPPTISNVNAFSNVNPTVVYVPTASVAAYKAATGWSAFTAVIDYPHGNCGDGEPATDAVTWAFDLATGTMTLSGTGAVKTFSDQNPMAYPWNSNEASVWNPTGMDGDEWGWLGVKSLVIGEGITNIPDYSFAMYIHLTSVSVPSTLTTIGASSLEECAFTSITLPEGLLTIGDYAFLASKFTSITLPSTLTTIGSSAFNNCESLTAITIPANVTAIGESAFLNCIALETVTMLRTTPPTLGEKAFYDYNDVIIPALTNIYVPSASVDAYKAANGWSTYADKIVANGGTPEPAVTTTFTYTASEKLTIFDNIEKFTGASSVKSHEFADGTGTVVYNGTVTAMADYTFRYDNDAKNKMTSITIPESVTNTGEYTFWSCKNLATVTFDGTPTLTTIGKSAFKECEALTAIAIPATVETIDESAFADCSELASVTFAENALLTTINSSAFSYCRKLTTITLPESLTTLGSVQTEPQTYYNGSVFWFSGLTSIVIPKNVTTIYGSGYFAACNMTSVIVDAENTKYADLDCNGIFEKATNKLIVGCNATTVPDGVTTIGYEAFWAVTTPFSLILPESVTTIEERAFHLADGLISINIPSGVTSIDADNFICQNVTDVYCYTAAADMTWEGFDQAFANPKSTKFHVIDADAWETKYPDANVFFVGDLSVAAYEVEDAHWATYYNSVVTMKADANTIVYKAANNGNYLKLTEIADKVINAGQAVILKSTGASILMTTQGALSTDDYSGNDLEGRSSAVVQNANYNYYAMANGNNGLAFYLVNSNVEIPAGKAYIKVEKSESASARAYYGFDEDVTTNISSIQQAPDAKNDLMFDLQGRRVAKPTKGLYIINGNKVVIK